MHPVSFFVFSDRINLLQQQYGEYLEVLTLPDKAALLAIIATCLHDRSQSGAKLSGNIRTARQEYPYAASSRVMNACVILSTANTAELTGVSQAIAHLIAAQQTTADGEALSDTADSAADVFGFRPDSVAFHYSENC